MKNFNGHYTIVTVVNLSGCQDKFHYCPSFDTNLGSKLQDVFR